MATRMHIIAACSMIAGEVVQALDSNSSSEEEESILDDEEQLLMCSMAATRRSPGIRVRNCSGEIPPQLSEQAFRDHFSPFREAFDSVLQQLQQLNVFNANDRQHWWLFVHDHKEAAGGNIAVLGDKGNRTAKLQTTSTFLDRCAMTLFKRGNARTSHQFREYNYQVANWTACGRCG